MPPAFRSCLEAARRSVAEALSGRPLGFHKHRVLPLGWELALFQLPVMSLARMLSAVRSKIKAGQERDEKR